MESYLETFVVWLLRTSWQAAVLVILILAVQWLFRNRLSARWKYALWVVVVVRLAVPYSPESPVSIFNVAMIGAGGGTPVPDQAAFESAVIEPPAERATALPGESAYHGSAPWEFSPLDRFDQVMPPPTSARESETFMSATASRSPVVCT